MAVDDSHDDRTKTFAALTAGTWVSHYKIISKLGAGGMGVVYLAEDTKLDRRVALKFLPARFSDDREAKARFTREAKAAAKLNHPNIVTIFEVGEFNGRPFFAMEHVEGQPLSHSCHGEPLPIRKVIDLAIQICEGLAEAHGSGVIHRDIKTSNIVVDSKGRPRLLDFGLAAVEGDEKLTKAGSTIGTVAYMSPEQAQGNAVDQRSDLFSFGTVLYELIAGRTPFQRDSDAATLKAIVNDPVEPLARYRAGAPDELQRIVAKLLQRDPALRYQTAEGVVSDLRLLAISGSSISIAPDKRKSKIWLAALGVAAVVVVAASIFFWLRSQEEAVESDKPPMLVVLPFENLGGPEDEYFATGMTDEITSRLVGIRGLGVISRTSAMRYRDSDKSLKEIGRELGVDYVLEGTVRWSKSGAEQRVRITPQLISVADDRHLWAENYERQLTEVFKVQSDIAYNIVEALGVTLLEPERAHLRPVTPTRNMAAYDYYLRGNDYMNRGWEETYMRSAVEMYKKAVKLDPTFAVAYARLAHAYNVLIFSFMSLSDLENAESALFRALELDPNLPEAHLALGSYHSMWTLEYDRARSEFKRASEGLINSAELYQQLGILNKREGLWEEALLNQEKALELNPRSVTMYEDIVNTHIIMRNYSEANRLLDSVMQFTTDSSEIYYWKVVTILLQKGDVQAARQVIAEAAAYLDPVDILWSPWRVGAGILGLWRFDLLEDNLQELPNRLTGSFISSRKHLYYASMAEIYRLLDQPDSANIFYDSARIFLEEKVQDYPDEYHYNAELSLIYMLLGRIEEAIEVGLRAKELLTIDDCHW